MKKSNIEEALTRGLDVINSNEQLTVKLKDMAYIYKTFEELNRFFHNPNHYPDLEHVKAFLGNKDEGMYSVIWHIYYRMFDEMLPSNIRDIFENMGGRNNQID